MGDLLIRADRAEKVLRSVGDAPNGIVCMVAPDDVAAWAIDAAYQPPHVDEIPGGGVVLDAAPNASGMGAASTIVDVDDLVAACESPLEASGLLNMVCTAAAWAARDRIALLQFEFVASHVKLAQATRDALERYGYLTRTAHG